MFLGHAQYSLIGSLFFLVGARANYNFLDGPCSADDGVAASKS